MNLSNVELRTGFDAFIAAAQRLEQGYAELKARAAAGFREAAQEDGAAPRCDGEALPPGTA